MSAQILPIIWLSVSMTVIFGILALFMRYNIRQEGPHPDRSPYGNGSPYPKPLRIEYTARRFIEEVLEIELASEVNGVPSQALVPGNFLYNIETVLRQAHMKEGILPSEDLEEPVEQWLERYFGIQARGNLCEPNCLTLTELRGRERPFHVGGTETNRAIFRQMVWDTLTQEAVE